MRQRTILDLSRSGRFARALFGTAILSLLVACGTTPKNGGAAKVPPRLEPRPFGAGVELVPGLSGGVLLGGLNNPSCVTFRPSDGAPTICDSGNGRVIALLSGGKVQPLIEGFATEYWKIDPATGEKRYKVGPLAALWLDDQRSALYRPDGRLAVTDGGRDDGDEAILFFDMPRDGRVLTPADGAATNPVGPTTDDKADKGEGNLTGMSLSPKGDRMYLCGQGTDIKTWLLVCDIAEYELKPFVAADEHGITVNSPMQTLPRGEGRLLALYSGAGGAEDSLLVEWDIEAKRPAARWTLPGLKDCMGMAFLPGSSDTLVIVDNNWALKTVNPGQAALVSIAKERAAVEVFARGLKGPVACAFGPDGNLYITTLGERFDESLGELVMISGLMKK